MALEANKNVARPMWAVLFLTTYGIPVAGDDYSPLAILKGGGSHDVLPQAQLLRQSTHVRPMHTIRHLRPQNLRNLFDVYTLCA